MDYKKTFPFYIAHGISKISNSLIDVFIIIFAAKHYAESPGTIGIIMFFKYIPYIIFGVYGGTFADSHNKIKIMYLSEIYRAALSVVLFFSIYSDNFIFLCLSLFLLTTARCFYQPSQQTLVTKLFSDKDFQRINSIFQAINEISDLIAPIILGVIFYLFIGDNINYIVIFLCVLMYFVSFLIFYFNKKKLYCNYIYKETKISSIIFFIPKSNILISNIFGSTICILFVSSIFKIIFPIFIVNTLALESKNITIFYTFMSLGTILSSGYIFRRGLKCENTMLFWLLYSFTILISFLYDNPIYICIFLFLTGCFGAVVDICIVTNIQKHSKKNEMGKNFGMFSFLANTSESISNLIIGNYLFMFPMTLTQYVGIILCILSILNSLFFIYLQVIRYEKV